MAPLILRRLQAHQKKSKKTKGTSQDEGNGRVNLSIPFILTSPESDAILRSTNAFDGAVAQLGEHKAGSLGVRGSIPLSSTNIKINKLKG